MLRVVEEAKPRWVVAENVRGLLGIESGQVFEEVAASLESIGYAVQTFCIPASAINAPHRRDRIWIIAHADGWRLQRGCGERNSSVEKRGKCEPKTENDRTEIKGASPVFNGNINSNSNGFASCTFRANENQGWSTESIIGGSSELAFTDTESARRQQHTGKSDGTTSAVGREIYARRQASQTDISCGNCSNVADSGDTGLQGNEFGRAFGKSSRSSRPVTERFENENWLQAATEFCRVDDVIPNRVDRLKSLGNSIVPQIAFQIFKAIEQTEAI